jgi:hypothetical protein
MCACVPPPPCRIAHRPPKTHIKRTLAGVLGRTLTRRALPRPPPLLISKKGQLADLLVFPYTRVRQYSLIGCRIGLTIKYGIILFFFLHEDICNADL